MEIANHYSLFVEVEGKLVRLEYEILRLIYFKYTIIGHGKKLVWRVIEVTKMPIKAQLI